MNLGDLFSKDILELGSLWKLQVNANGFQSLYSNQLSTQAVSGRSFEFIEWGGTKKKSDLKGDRIKVRLLEDGYTCWLSLPCLHGNAVFLESWRPILISEDQIKKLIPFVLDWVLDISKFSGKYLWGGTIGPDFDCSGLIQAAFSSQNIWLPRDAYQQEIFCEPLSVNVLDRKTFLPGDLFFFGTSEKCDHVGLHIENGLYWHSSGVSQGHNGIAIDDLIDPPSDSIGAHYKSKFRTARRVISCYDGGNLPN